MDAESVTSLEMQQLMLPATLDSLDGFTLYRAGVRGSELSLERRMDRFYRGDFLSESGARNRARCAFDFR
jgi:hypothetical protein